MLRRCVSSDDESKIMAHIQCPVCCAFEFMTPRIVTLASQCQTMKIDIWIAQRIFSDSSSCPLL